MQPAPNDLQEQLIRAAVTLAAKRHIARLFYVCDLPIPARLLRPAIQRKLVQVVSAPPLRDSLDEEGKAAVLVPSYDLGRHEKFRLALVGAAGRRYVKEGDTVVGLIAGKPRVYPDTLLLSRIEKGVFEATSVGEVRAGRIAPSVFESIIELAVELGIEGWEGHALGTMFVLGDSARILESSRQIALNPFQGYSEQERNLADPAVRDALRSFATLDGAFVVREDGVVLAAGRYLQFEARSDIEIPLGLGSRHVAAASCTAATDAVAVVVSQSTGKVRVFRKGRIVLELSPSHRRT